MHINRESVPSELLSLLDSYESDPEAHGTVDDWLCWERLMNDSDASVVGKSLMEMSLSTGIDCSDYR